MAYMNREDIVVLADEIRSLSDQTYMLKTDGAPAITDSASGKIASFSDGAEAPLKSLIFNIEPQQSGSGDPSPSNIRPISGTAEVDGKAAGKNLLSSTWERKGGYWYSPWAANNRLAQPAVIKVKPSTTYTISRGSGELRYAVQQYANSLQVQASNPVLNDSGWKTGDSFLFTTLANTHYVWVCLSSPNYSYDITPADGIAAKIQLEEGATATAYEAPQTTPITIDLGRTVYGGTVDVIAGKLTAKPYYASYSGQTLVGPWISSHDKYVSGATPTTGAQVVDMGAAGTDYDLTPVSVNSLLGQNNIWHSAGETEVEYVADTKLFIERLTAPTEDDFIANANIASGKYFMVGNNLYLSTAAISAGETIQPGTNCTLTNLAAALNAINA